MRYLTLYAHAASHEASTLWFYLKQNPERFKCRRYRFICLYRTHRGLNHAGVEFCHFQYRGYKPFHADDVLICHLFEAEVNNRLCSRAVRSNFMRTKQTG